MIQILAITVLSVIATPAPAYKEDVAKSIQGDWVVKSVEINGMAEKKIGETINISADRFTPPDPEPSYPYKLGTADKLQTIDISGDAGPLKGNRCPVSFHLRATSSPFAFRSRIRSDQRISRRRVVSD
jgi:uncharacterized protein (TIGR03067 family)